MDFEITTPAPAAESPIAAGDESRSAFAISSRPVIAGVEAGAVDRPAPQLPRSYGTQTVTLHARDQHVIFAFWDIDWDEAFQSSRPTERAVYLRLFDEAGDEKS
ncbi:MAG: hypothetical protein M3Z22_02915, partial [Verrucomicrobiota bacterium]|nr:hypothetical protein [Verrucomicrobiota bacterium]